jgi:hypothetical protein
MVIFFVFLITHVYKLSGKNTCVTTSPKTHGVKICNWYEMIMKLKLTHFFEYFRLDSCIYTLFVIIMWIFVFLNDHVDIPSPSKIMLMIEPRIITKTR